MRQTIVGIKACYRLFYYGRMDIGRIRHTRHACASKGILTYNEKKMKYGSRDEILSSVKLFIDRFYYNHYNKRLHLEINEETQIVDDLEILGEDIDLFLNEFVREFKLNFKNFSGKKYFGYVHEDFDILFPILRFFFRRKKWIPLPKKERKNFTVGLMIEAIERNELL